jgi:hypothetical protein
MAPKRRKSTGGRATKRQDALGDRRHWEVGEHAVDWRELPDGVLQVGVQMHFRC